MANAGKAATGALTGAGTGAMVGSAFGPMGTAIGAVGGGLIGGVSGLFSGDDEEAGGGRNGFVDDLNTNMSGLQDPRYQRALQAYQSGQGSIDDVYASISQMSPQEQNGAMNNFLSNGATGSMFASNQVQNDPIMGQLYGQGGALSRAVGKEQQLQNQGYQLTPEDQTMYGQVSGDVARLFGQQENAAANSLAMRGLSAAPSGAAGATFSGLAGNKNEMLAKAQQNIMQQRYQNTIQQIGQQQQFINSLGAQGQNAIQQQYGRQLAGSNQYWSNLMGGAKAQQDQNAGGLDAKKFNAENQSAGVGDMAQGMMGAAMGGFGKTMGQNMASNAPSMFNSTAPTAGGAGAASGGSQPFNLGVNYSSLGGR